MSVTVVAVTAAAAKRSARIHHIEYFVPSAVACVSVLWSLLARSSSNLSSGMASSDWLIYRSTSAAVVSPLADDLYEQHARR